MCALLFETLSVSSSNPLGYSLSFLLSSKKK